MSVKASISVSEQQDAFMRSLVADGRFSSASAVIQRGLDLLQTELDREAAELAALQAFFADRQAGAFEDNDKARAASREMIARKRAEHGL